MPDLFKKRFAELCDQMEVLRGSARSINGMYLRRTWDSKVPGQKRATAHQHLHSPKYHDAVLLELSLAFRAGTHAVRPTLQNIKGKILTDAFDY